MSAGGEGFESCYVFDNRPLINFLLTRSQKLAQSVCGGNACTTQSVQAQFEKSARVLGAGCQDVQIAGPGRSNIAGATCTSWSSSFGPNAIEIVNLPLSQAHITLELERRYPLALDPGESDVLALCVQRSWVAILDDFPAREVALELGIATIGTVELLIRAVTQGLLDLDKAEDLLESMRQIPWNRAPDYSLSDVMSGQVAVWPGIAPFSQVPTLSIS